MRQDLLGFQSSLCFADFSPCFARPENRSVLENGVGVRAYPGQDTLADESSADVCVCLGDDIWPRRFLVSMAA